VKNTEPTGEDNKFEQMSKNVPAASRQTTLRSNNTINQPSKQQLSSNQRQQQQQARVAGTGRPEHQTTTNDKRRQAPPTTTTTTGGYAATGDTNGRSTQQRSQRQSQTVTTASTQRRGGVPATREPFTESTGDGFEPVLNRKEKRARRDAACIQQEEIMVGDLSAAPAPTRRRVSRQHHSNNLCGNRRGVDNRQHRRARARLSPNRRRTSPAMNCCCSRQSRMIHR
jgi:hypothetical protein